MTIPIWKQTANEFVATDAVTGKRLKTVKRPALPDGTLMEAFKHYPARVLKPIKTGFTKRDPVIPVGHIMGAQCMGVGIYLVEGHMVHLTDAKEGVDFEFV